MEEARGREGDGWADGGGMGEWEGEEGPRGGEGYGGAEGGYYR